MLISEKKKQIIAHDKTVAHSHKGFVAA